MLGGTYVLGPYRFLSTPSARRATMVCLPIATACVFLSTPSARRATCVKSRCGTPSTISIHALREEGDSLHPAMMVCSLISIHALREEGDAGSNERYNVNHDFYPRPPRGGRRRNVGLYFVQLLFLSTPSARRATHYKASTDKKANDFYPRPPRGGRQLAAAFYNAGLWISIHALREEGDDKIPYVEHFLDISIHALREEGDRTAQASSMRP